MPTFQFSPTVEINSFFDTSSWVLTSISSTKAVWESGDQKLEVIGTSLSLAGGVDLGTITGARLYEVDLSSGSAVDALVATNTSALSLSFAGMLAAVNSSEYYFGGAAYIFSGNDTLNGSAREDFMEGGAGNDVLNGGAANDYLSGDEQASSFGAPGGRDTLNGGEGDDVLSGGGGNDSMVGGNGNDYYFVTDAGDVVTEASGAAAGTHDRVNFSTQNGLLSYTLAANVENLEVSPYSMTGTPITVTGTGNGLANKITVVDFSGGFSPSSTKLFGLGGNDRLTGGAGRDSLDGGTGTDTLIGGLGSDTYTVADVADVVSEAIVFPVPNSDVDALVFAVSTASTVSLGGTAPAGLTPTKTYSGIEALSLGTAGSTLAHNGIGNDAANTINGNAAANRLYGLNGNDTLKGGAGNDQLFGGSGSDTIVFGSRSGSDRVGDFKVSGSDKILVDQSDVGGIGNNDTVRDGAISVAGPGGFNKAAELVIITGNISGAITTTSAAAKIGSATGGAYAINDDRIFVVDNNTDSAVFLFTAKDADAAVEANELILLATLAGTASTAIADYVFGA